MGSQEGWLCWQGCCERSINAAASIHPWIYVSPLSLFLCLFFPPSSFLFSSLSTSFFPHAHLLSRNFVVSFCLELVSIFHVPSPIVSSLSFPTPPFFIRVVPKRFAVLCLCFKIEVHSTFSSWSILRVPAYTLPVSSSFSFFSVCLFVERRNPLDFTLDFSHRFSHERLDFYFRKTALALSDTLSLFAFPAKGILACTLRSNV